MIIDVNRSEQIDKIVQEMRRGILIVAVLSQLHAAKYGYALISDLEVRGLTIDQGTLYPLLRRLEEQGLLDSTWDTEGTRPRRYYQINAAGAAVLAALKTEWQSLQETIDRLLMTGENDAEQLD